MIPFTTLEGIAAPLPQDNIDTDKILPGSFLSTISKAGLGKALFWAMRKDQAFVLNTAPWTKSRILISGDNFGCGSSREHAPWALLDFGICCVVAESFADIFHNNCYKNGILPITLDTGTVARLMALAADPSTATMSVDLPAQTLVAGGETIDFAIDPGRKRDLLEARDDIAGSLAQSGAIDAFESARAAAQPWFPASLRLAELPDT